MTEPRSIVTFVPYAGYHAGFLGVHFVGAVRERAGGGEWIFLLGEPPGDRAALRWKRAGDVDAAKAALIRSMEDWWDAAHEPLAADQGERIARIMRVSI